MSARHLKIIALAFAGLLLAWGASELFSRGSHAAPDTLTLPALALGDVDTIAVTTGTDSVVLAKQSSSVWVVNGYRAGPDAVNEFVQALKDTVQPELVAQDSSSFRRLEVDSATGRWLRIRGGGRPLLDLIVGARGSEYSSAYVRRPSDSRAYLWRGRLAQLVSRTPDEWRDKRIAAVEPDSIAVVAVERGPDRYTLKRAGQTWTLNGVATDSGAVPRALERYRTIVSAGFATRAQADSVRGRRPARRLTLRSAHGGTLLALVFDSIPGGFWARRTGGTAAGGDPGTVYRMNSWDVDGLTPASRALLPAAP